MPTPTDEPTAKEKLQAVGQIALGLAQVMGATVAFYLLVQTGLNEWSVGAAAVTGVLTLATRILFGRRR
jgi:hypothetical protein